MSSARLRLRALVVSGAAALVACLLLASGADASVRCTHTASPADELRVFPYEDPNIDLDFADGVVRRDGDRIQVLDVVNGEVKCAGPAATAANTGTILFLQSGLAFSTLDLSGGLPAPHIEFRSDLGALGYGTVAGGDGPDRWVLGGTTSAVGLALDPAAPQTPQITWDGLGQNVPVIVPGGGNDTVDASAIRRRHTITLINGGAGNDTLLGSPFGDAIQGGPGRDVIAGGGGNDELDGRDGFPDRLDCGAGTKDKAKLGRRDTVKGCEKIERPGHRHRGRIPKPPWLS
jgi:Ca2+-binding RTX toxin-like protein